MEDKGKKKAQGQAEARVVGNKGKMVKIKFRQNRKYDLHIGRNMITFFGREDKIVPESWAKHKDFENIKSLFIIKGGV